MIADLVGSRKLTVTDRRAVQASIRTTLGPRGAFRFAGGDEFEWALPDLPEALDDLLRLRLRLGAGLDGLPPVHLRVGVGRGEVWVEDPDTPYGEDGPAYHRARAAMNRLRDKPARGRRTPDRPLEPVGATPRMTLVDDGRPHPVRDALCLHIDLLMARWTLLQWEACHLAATGRTYAAIGRELGIREQTVHKRLSTAQFDAYLEGHAALKATWTA